MTHAELFIREGNYEYAFNLIYTAFSDYIRHTITEHGVYFESDESMHELLAKLHEYYCLRIRPSDAGDRIKDILLSTGGFLDKINELRNNTTAADSDGQLLEKREAQLAVSLINSIVDYIDDVEKELS